MRKMRLLNFSYHTYIFSLLAITLTLNTAAHEGMWMPPLIQKQQKTMKSMGLDIPVTALYNEEGTGLNNAVVLFGRGCTGEIISSKGLVLTNHHCGYGSVQGLSNEQHDYFANGFWAKSMDEEIPCPGLTVSFVRKMEDVTSRILSNIDDTLNDASRDSIISVRIKNLEQGYKYTTGYDAVIKPFYDGNQYWVTLTETFRDIRLVGFPPNGIGYFGGDAENWSWPRHTGDFSIFRVYANKDNRPADYSTDNRPYNTKQFFTISAKGYKEGDFTMVYGFPGTTNEYISSYQLNDIYTITDPIRVQVRTQKLHIWDSVMHQSRETFLKYTSKRAGIANGWKKWQGELHGLTVNKVVEKKEAYETGFQAWANHDTAMPYAGSLLQKISASAISVEPLMKVDEYIKEAVLGVELIQLGGNLDRILQGMKAASPGNVRDTVISMMTAMSGFYKNYDPVMDEAVFRQLIPMFLNNCQGWIPTVFKNQLAAHEGSIPMWSDAVYHSSMATNYDGLIEFASSVRADDTMLIQADPAWQLYHAITTLRNQQILPKLSDYYRRLNYFNRLYMKAQIEKDKNKDFYPDANLTLRITYGKIEGLDPEGPAGYSFQTNLDEVIANDNPTIDEFKVPQKLKELYNAKKYGKWSVNGTVPVAFIATNHTSGGNSGSPVLNSRGELIGTNFDRAWEGTMSDLYFDPNLCRNISLDVRYTLFIIEQFGGAGWLLKEMNIKR